MKNFGDYLRVEREADGLTRLDVAELLASLKLSGMNRPWPGAGATIELLARIEGGTHLPNERQLLALRLVLPTLRLDRARRLLVAAKAGVEASNG